MLVPTVCSNLSLDDRRVLTLAKEPFSFLAMARTPQRWWAIVEDVRTWLLDTHDVHLPEDRPVIAS